jgi:hypothetical protein
MSAFGYEWHQTLIGRIEAAQRPLRLNEAVDLAALYGVPLERLLRPAFAAITAERLDTEIEQARSRLTVATRDYEEVEQRWQDATARLAVLGDEHTRAQTAMRTAEADLARLMGLRLAVEAAPESSP